MCQTLQRSGLDTERKTLWWSSRRSCRGHACQSRNRKDVSLRPPSSSSRRLIQTTEPLVSAHLSVAYCLCKWQPVNSWARGCAHATFSTRWIKKRFSEGWKSRHRAGAASQHCSSQPFSASCTSLITVQRSSWAVRTMLIRPDLELWGLRRWEREAHLEVSWDRGPKPSLAEHFYNPPFLLHPASERVALVVSALGFFYIYISRLPSRLKGYHIYTKVEPGTKSNRACAGCL